MRLSNSIVLNRFLTASTASLVACATTLGQATQPAPATPTIKMIEPGAAPLKAIRIHPVKGAESDMRMTMRMSMQQTMGTAKMPAMQTPTATMNMHCSVTDVRGNGDIVTQFKLTAVDIPDDPSANPAMAEPFRAAMKGLVGMNCTVECNGRGVCISSKVEVPPDAPPSVQQQMENMKQTFNQMCIPFPEEPVGVGGRWNVLTQVGQNGLSVDQTTEYHLVKAANDDLEFEIHVTQKAEPQDMHLPSLPAGTTAHLNSLHSTGAGTMSMNLVTMIPNSKISTTNDSDISFTMNGTTQSMQQQMEITMTTERAAAATKDSPKDAPQKK